LSHIVRGAFAAERYRAARMIQLEARDERSLRAISGEVHDWFFDLGDVALHADRRELVVPFRRWEIDEARRIAGGRLVDRMLRRTSWEAPWYRWYRRVYDVESYTVADDAAIGGADFNAVIYDAASNVVTIHGDVPVTLDVEIRNLHVSVEQTSDRLGLARYTSWLGGISYSGEIRPVD
jgi:hypothetical protein